jgi:hypothetical protein
MARVHVSSLGLSLSRILAFFFFSKLCFCFNPKHLNLSTITTHWSSAGATWYGSPDGFGSDGNVQRESEREREFLYCLLIVYILCRRGLWVRQYGIQASILFHGYGNRPISLQLRQRMWCLLSGSTFVLSYSSRASFIIFYFFWKHARKTILYAIFYLFLPSLYIFASNS